MPIVIAVALGGALGAVLRYGVGLWATFPFGTLCVNVLGSFAIGIIWAGLVDKTMTAGLAFVMVGCLGGFTTFSTFSLDALRLVQEARLAAALSYIGASLFLSLGACALGLFLGARGAV